MRVTIPDTKNIVERIYPLAGSLASMHNLGQMINGIDTVAPNIVKKCYKLNTIDADSYLFLGYHIEFSNIQVKVIVKIKPVVQEGSQNVLEGCLRFHRLPFSPVWFAVDQEHSNQ